MAAFSTPSYTSRMEPVLPEEQVLHNIFQHLRNSNWSALEDEILSLGFSYQVVDRLKNDPDFNQLSLQQLDDKLKLLRKEKIEFTVESYAHWVEQTLVDDNLTLHQKLLLSGQPEVIKGLERKWYLPQTGDINSLIKNYRERKYTRSCFLYHPENPNYCMEGAAKYGHQEIFDESIRKGADNYTIALAAAIKNHHDDIAQLIVEKYLAEGRNVDDMMNMVAGFGSIHLVKLMLDRGATNYDEATMSAAINGHADIVQLMIDKGVTTYEDVLDYIIQYGQPDRVKELIKLLSEKTGTDYDEAMATARGIEEEYWRWRESPY